MSLVLMTGCATPQKPIYLASSFKDIATQTITILPVIDSRTERYAEDEEFELQQVMNQAVATGLKEKGYTIEFSIEFGGSQCLTTDDSTQLGSECVRSLGPQNSTWVLIVFLKDFQRRKAIGSGVNVKISGVLLDKSQDSELRRDQAHAGAGRGGLGGMAMDSLLDKEIIQQCTRNLLTTLPVRDSNRNS